MIVYFSGTGNSRWVAEELAKRLGDEAICVTQFDQVDQSQPFGLVCPIYAWQVPEIMERFWKQHELDPSTYRYAVVTCGDNVGRAIEKLDQIQSLDAAFSVTMPNNYVIGFDIDSPEVIAAKLTAADSTLDDIVADIQAQRSIRRYEKGKLAWYFGGLAGWAFRKFARTTKPFYVQDQCIRCGRCARDCPEQVIKLVTGKPTWQVSNCQMCLKCLHACPVQAIQYGRSTVKKGRYTLEKWNNSQKEMAHR